MGRTDHPDLQQLASKLQEAELANRTLAEERDRLLLEVADLNRELKSRVREKSEALQRAQSEIAQTEKLAALGYLAAGMAHEIRNPLNSISLFTQLISEGVEEIEPGDYLVKILKEVERIDSIIRNLVDAANRSRHVSTDLGLEQVIEAALEIFTPQIEARGIQVSNRNHGELPKIRADRTELEQIFTNLFMNAIDVLPQGGELQICSCCNNGQIEVRVTDNGGGISAPQTDDIFKPFFSTKSRGTGIGLPVARRIARLYQGDLVVENSSSKGTTFLVTIPYQKPSRQPSGRAVKSG